MKPIFNSLGSNYSFKFLLMALGVFSGGKENRGSQTLKALLKEKFGGEVFLTYKGRDAIQVALAGNQIGVGDQVSTQAFSCFAVEEAIVRAGAKPIYVDVEEGKVNLSVESLQVAFSKSENVKAVIVQHSLGQPAQIQKIKVWCDQQKLLLIEDLAQSIGGSSFEGKKLGSYGDVVVLSFGRDKIVDAVSGGAVVFRKSPISLESLQTMSRVSKVAQFKDRLYPLITRKIRVLYNLGIGRIIHWTSVKLGLITSPVMSHSNQVCSMPEWMAKLVVVQLGRLNEQIEHRRKIARVYWAELKDETKLQIVGGMKEIEQGSNQRFSILVSNPLQLIKHLQKSKIFVADRWYRSAVDFGKLKIKSAYKKGSCLNAEEISKQIVNLPTHQNVTVSDAKQVSSEIKKWSHLL